MSYEGPLAPPARPPAQPPGEEQRNAYVPPKVKGPAERTVQAENLAPKPVSPEEEVSFIRRILSAAWKVISAPFPTLDIQKILQNFRCPFRKAVTNNKNDTIDISGEHFRKLTPKEQISILTAQGIPHGNVSTLINNKEDAEHFKRCIKALPTPSKRIAYLAAYGISSPSANALKELLSSDADLLLSLNKARMDAVLMGNEPTERLTQNDVDTIRQSLSSLSADELLIYMKTWNIKEKNLIFTYLPHLLIAFKIAKGIPQPIPTSTEEKTNFKQLLKALSLDECIDYLQQYISTEGESEIYKLTRDDKKFAHAYREAIIHAVLYKKNEHRLGKVLVPEIRKTILSMNVQDRFTEFKRWWILTANAVDLLDSFPSYMKTQYRMARDYKIEDIIKSSKNTPAATVIEDINTTLRQLSPKDKAAYLFANFAFTDHPEYLKLDLDFRNQLDLAFLLFKPEGIVRSQSSIDNIDKDVIAIANSLKKSEREIDLTPPLLHRFIQIISTLDPQDQKALLERCNITKDSPLYKKLPTNIQETL